MFEEKPEVEQQEDENSYYDDVRADIETAIYAFSILQEVDAALMGKITQKNITKAKSDCVFIICKGLKLLKEGYNEPDEEE